MKKTMLAVICLGAMSSSQTAQACCGDGAIAAQGAAAAGHAVVAAIGEAASTLGGLIVYLLVTLANGFTQVSGEITKQTAQYKTIQQGVVAANSALYMAQASGAASTMYEVSPRSCYEVSMGAASSLSHAEVKAAHADLNQNSVSRNLGNSSTAAAVKQIVKKHEQFCSALDASLGRCSAVSQELQNADLRADTITSNASLDSDKMTAAQSFANNVTNPVPTQQIPKEWESSPQGKAFLAGQYIEQARLSVAQNSLNAAIAARTPITGLGTSAQLNKADVSEAELMESMVRGRFENPEWYALIAGFSLENLMREQNKMQAFQLWMDLKSYQQFERIETVLATQLAMTVKQGSEDRLAKARNVAAKANGAE